MESHRRELDDEKRFDTLYEIQRKLAVEMPTIPRAGIAEGFDLAWPWLGNYQAIQHWNPNSRGSETWTRVLVRQVEGNRIIMLVVRLKYQYQHGTSGGSGMLTKERIDELVEMDKGRIDISLYTDEEIFEAELQRIFYTTWVFVGHESEIKEAGDYKTSYIGRIPVIVSRDENMEVHVLINRCAHRGPTVCQHLAGEPTASTVLGSSEAARHPFAGGAED